MSTHGTVTNYKVRGCRCSLCAEAFRAKRQAFEDDRSDPRHGTANGYMNLRCRCDGCRTAGVAAGTKARAARWAKRVTQADGTVVHPDAPHGSYWAYFNYGCLCSLCTEARNEYGRVRAEEKR